jgi:hypothetical protein
MQTSFEYLRKKLLAFCCVEQNAIWQNFNAIRHTG